MKKTTQEKAVLQTPSAQYGGLIGGIAELLEVARCSSARAVNALMTATYWEIGRRIVEFEQGGEKRAQYGEELLIRLAVDLTSQFGRGFSRRNLQIMRQFFAAFPSDQIWQTLSAKSAIEEKRAPPSLESDEAAIAQTLSAKFASSISETVSRKLLLTDLAAAFPLPWSHYVLLINRSRSPEARDFYHAEALRGGWSVRQLDRQIASQFYERTALSRDKAAMLSKGSKAQAEDFVVS